MLEITLTPSFLSRLRNAEHYDLFNNVVIRYRPGGLKPAAIAAIWNAFLQAFDKEDELYKRSAGREETIFIRDANEKRRVSFMAFKRLVEAAAYSETPAVKAAAESLLRVFDNYAQAYYAPMTEASALIVNMLQDINVKHSAQMALITGSADVFNRLERDNNAFMSLYAGRTYSGEEQKIEGNLRDARIETDKRFNALVGAINAFYYTNEILPTKDPDVSKVLGDAILFINSYLRQYELIYSRRAPKRRPGKGGHPAGPDEPLPIDETPTFEIDAQTTLGNSVGVTGYGIQMSFRANDAENFAAVLDPAALDGSVRLMNPETEAVDEFPVAGFMVDEDGTTVIGLLVNAPASNVYFEKPFMGIGDAQPAEVVKDGALLAILLDVKYPATMIAT
jgi:hypothetical protein